MVSRSGPRHIHSGNLKVCVVIMFSGLRFETNWTWPGLRLGATIYRAAYTRRCLDARKLHSTIEVQIFQHISVSGWVGTLAPALFSWISWRHIEIAEVSGIADGLEVFGNRLKDRPHSIRDLGLDFEPLRRLQQVSANSSHLCSQVISYSGPTSWILSAESYSLHLHDLPASFVSLYQTKHCSIPMPLT